MLSLLNIWRRHPILTTGLAIAAALTLFFAIRMTMFTIYWADPAHRDQAVAGWMTPGYVVHSWRIPDQLMRDTLGPKPDRPRPMIADFAADQGISTKELIDKINAAIAAHRASEAASK